MATETTDVGASGGVRGMADRANPAFAAGVVAVPVLALAYAVVLGSIETLTYVHVMAGVLWTGVDVFLGAVLGPVIGSLDPDARAAFFQRFTPKMTFAMPTLATVTIAGGIVLALRRGLFPNADPWLALFSTVVTLGAVGSIGYQFDALRSRRFLATFGVLAVAHAGWLAVTLPSFGPTSPLVAFALAVVAVLSIQGFGVILPGEVRIYREMTSADPDADLIGEIGMRNAKLGGLQGALQLVLVASMVLLRWT